MPKVYALFGTHFLLRGWSGTLGGGFRLWLVLVIGFRVTGRVYGSQGLW